MLGVPEKWSKAAQLMVEGARHCSGQKEGKGILPDPGLQFNFWLTALGVGIRFGGKVCKRVVLELVLPWKGVQSLGHSQEPRP